MIRFIVLLLFLLPVERVLCQDQPRQEFRGIWVATINNIDWPSAPGLTVEQQKKELTDLIDRIDRFNLNAVFFLVRAAADAFYASDIEPWSYFLTAKQGRPTNPSFDPLAYAVGLCHAREIEIHAWFNPFRVRNIGNYELAKNSFAAKNPQFIHDYDNKRFFDPGYPQVRAHIIKVILEVVRKYNIDAVLLDDYFYPYPVKGKSFPDSKTFAKYGKVFYPKHLKDWRRNNIDRFISDLHDSIKSVKPGLRFGISPFGVWRNHADDPNGSPGVKGTTSYDDLYADVYKWLSKSWIDYVVPQLYWEQGNRFGDFTLLTKWWNDHCCGKPLYLGQALYKSTDLKNAWSNPKEISDQISIMRKYENVRGFAFYSASHLTKLSDVETSELNVRLLKPKTDTSNIPGSSSTNKITGILIDSIQNNQSGKIFVMGESSFEKTINISHNKGNINFLPVPGKFKLRKNRKEWLISWTQSDSLKKEGQKIVLLAYEPKKDTGYIKKVFILPESKQVLIHRGNDFNPKKVLYRFVSINQSNSQRSFSRLFRMRRNRIVYN
jgi:uncharacterized lipoprotein YddW (UPF0748 family)